MTMNPELKPFIATLGLEYSATFVPQSLSRNRGEKHPSLNWRVVLAKGGDAILTDYMQGIAHVPGYSKMPRLFDGGPREWQFACHRAAETGRYPVRRFLDKPLPPPDLTDVLYGLTIDGDAADYTFEDWCSNYDYDTDSRKAEETYNVCREHGRKLQRMLGAASLAKLRDLFQDY
jgi:hypothetical protein